MDDPTVGNVKKSLSSFFGQVSEALIPSLEDDESDAVLITNDGQVTLVGFQKHLAELQAADETYLTAPAASLSENYQRWLEVTEQDQFTQNRLAKHLTSSEILNEKYLSLVPDQIAHMEFWQRYLFRRALLEDALANAELAERRAKNEANSVKTTSPIKSGKTIIQTEQPKRILGGDEGASDDVDDLAFIETAVAATDDREAAELESAFGTAGQVLRKQEDEAKWDTEDFASVEISEEEQLRLLQEYENEIQEREKKKSLCIPLEEKLRLEKLSQEETAEKVVNTKGAPKPVAKATTQKAAPSKKSVVETKVSADRNRVAKSNSSGNTAKINATKNNTTKTNDATSSKSVATKPTTTTTPTNTDVTQNEYQDEAANSDESWEKDFDLSDTK